MPTTSLNLEVLEQIEPDGVSIAPGVHSGYLKVHPVTKGKTFWISPDSHTDDFNVTSYMGNEVRSV